MVSWNVAGRVNADMTALLTRDAPDLVLLQEVTESVWAGYRAAFPAYWKAFSLDHRPQPEALGRRYGLGTAILGGPRTRCRSQRLPLQDLVQPERVLDVDVGVDGLTEPITAVSYHALHGGHGADKPRVSAAVGDWLEQQNGPVLVGMDANSPDVDHPDFKLTRCHWAQQPFTDLEPRLLGPTKTHRLRDLWREHLEQDHEALATLRRDRPTGPLAVSHIVQGRPRRYDHLWATPDINVEALEYDQLGLADGHSDHALIRATLVAGGDSETHRTT